MNSRTRMASSTVYSGSSMGRPARWFLRFFILSVALLNMGGVLQHDIQQIRRQASGDDTALKALLDQQRDTAGVVDMGVGHDDVVM